MVLSSFTSGGRLARIGVNVQAFAISLLIHAVALLVGLLGWSRRPPPLPVRGAGPSSSVLAIPIRLAGEAYAFTPALEPGVTSSPDIRAQPVPIGPEKPPATTQGHRTRRSTRPTRGVLAPAPPSEVVADRSGLGRPERKSLSMLEAGLVPPPLQPMLPEPPPSLDGPRPVAPGLAEPAPGAPVQMPTAEARGLRIYETFPDIPDALKRSHSRHDILVQICVDPSGAVERALLQRASHSMLDDLLLKAIRSWRYQPYVLYGASRPFCHLLRVIYDIE